MKKRNVALCVIFSIVTFGIYGLYWMAQINNCANELADPPKKTGGGVAVLLTIVTLGIYGFYFTAKRTRFCWCKRADRRCVNQNKSARFAGIYARRG